MPLAWRPLPVLGLWAVSGVVLSELTGRVHDWFDMTDEMRYERLAISIARTHSLVPTIHGVDIQSYSQLYPLLIAPFFAHGLVPARPRADARLRRMADVVGLYPGVHARPQGRHVVGVALPVVALLSILHAVDRSTRRC